MEQKQNGTPSNLQGKMIGASLTVNHAEDVRDFYKQVIGWEYIEFSQGNYSDYRMTTPDGQFAAGVHHPAGIFSGLPPVWIPTFLVSDLRESLEACKNLGGKVLVEPMTYEKNSGAVIEYPVGAICGLCQGIKLEDPSENRLPDIRKTLIVDFPIQKVWQAIATSEGIAAWFMPNDFQPAQGHKFYLDATPLPLGLTPCKVTLIEPPNRLSYEWGKDWHLTFELNEMDGQTEITVIHSGWDANKVAGSGMPHTVVHDHMTQGWTVLINRLVRRAINTGGI